MPRYYVEFDIAGEEDGWEVEAVDESGADRVVVQELLKDGVENSKINVYRVSKMGDCAS
jgi:hypothetical protein